MSETILDSFCNKFNTLTKRPEKYISAPEKLINNLKELIKETYDFTKKEETNVVPESLPELIVDNFDTEQIWQQVELQNESILAEYLKSVSKLVAARDRLWFINNNFDDDDDDKNVDEIEDENQSNDEKSESENESEAIDNDKKDEESENDEAEDEQTEKKTLKQKPKSIVDDFFKLNEMEQFLKKEEQNQSKERSDESEDEESVDLFEKNSDDVEYDSENSESQANPKYDDFFCEPKETKKRKQKFDDESEIENEEEKDVETKKRKQKFDEESEVEEEKDVKSSLELREERLKRKIEDIEEAALDEKPWQLKGEITADKRPQNSLLEEIVDFDVALRPAPEITEETTFRLEDIIKQRIKDKVWDDVERKTKMVDTPLEYKKKLMLDQEKSKQSLAQIYEEEYIKQRESLNPNETEKPDEEPKEHLEIKAMMKSLFSKLDALSHFHFTPKSIQPELRIVNNLPAINMEEVAPVAASDAALLAPEEVHKKPKGEVIGKEERTDTDKKRERRQKKQKQRDHAKAKQQKEKVLEKMKPGLGNKYSKQKISKMLDKLSKDKNVDKMDESIGNKGIKSSTAFFNQLQDEVKSHIKSKVSIKNKKLKPTHNAKRLKL